MNHLFNCRVFSVLCKQKTIFTAPLWLMLFFVSTSSYAKVSPTTTNKRVLSSLAVGDSLVTSIQNVNNDTQSVHRIWNRITLSICTDTNLCYTDSFSFTALFMVRYFDKATSTYHEIDTITLTVSYNPFTGRLYSEKSTYSFSDAYKVSIIPLSYSDNGLLGRVCVFNEMEEERRWNMAYYLSTTISGFNISYNSTDKIYTISWTPKDWAEEYDLEWTWVDDYERVGVYLSASDVYYNYRFNSGRVTVKGTSYQLNNLFEHGYIVVRVRGVGYGGTDFRHRIAAAWSFSQETDDVQYMITNYPDHVITVDYTTSHEPYLNWQYQATYAEEGKKKEVISYFDGSLRNRQSVTKTNSDNTAIVAETFYDHQGRAAVSALPVPAFNARVSYYSNFNVNQLNEPYSKLDFDLDSIGAECITPPHGMDTLSGASRYYSSYNPYKSSGVHQYIADAALYPFTQVEYTPDNTGRVKRQSGVGPTHKLGSGHETISYYGAPLDGELERLFGTNVGSYKHYTKNMVQDANGQMSVSYMDASGKVVATALAGNSPQNVASLASLDSSVFSTNLIAAKDTILNEDELTFERKILVAADNTDYYFKYSLESEQFNAACNTCFNCVYDLEISLTDECFAEVMPGGNPIKRTIGTLQESGFDTVCSEEPLAYAFSTDASFSGILTGTGNQYIKVTLNKGEYHLTKKLQVNTEALDFYANRFIEQGLATGCILNEDSFIRDAYRFIDTTTCEMDCNKCREMLGADTTFMRQYITVLIEDSIVPTAYDSTVADSLYDIRVAGCDAYCDTGVNLCRSYYMMMLAHVSPGGQYGRLQEVTSDSVTVPALWYSVFAAKYAYENTFPSNVAYKYLDSVIRETGMQYDSVYVNGIKRSVVSLSPSEIYLHWQPEWADYFVKLHPEYCSYLNCKDNHDNSSHQYDIDMLRTDGYQAALDSGYLNPLGSTDEIRSNSLLPYSLFGDNHRDPYFTVNSSLKALMKDSLENYRTINSIAVSAWELMILSNCIDTTNTSNFTTCINDFLGNINNNCADSATYNQYWYIYRGIYLHSKRKIQEAQRLSPDHCRRSYWATHALYDYIPEGDRPKFEFVFPDEQLALAHISGSGGKDKDIGFQKDTAEFARTMSCINQCTSYADWWMRKLSSCAFNNPTDSANFDTLLIRTCILGCDQNNPMGSNTISPVNKAKNFLTTIGANSYHITSFEDAFNAYVAEGKITPADIRTCNINLIDMPRKYNHDYFFNAYNPIHYANADTFSTIDSNARFGFDDCSCDLLNEAKGRWDTSATLQSCYDSVHWYVNGRYKTNFTYKGLLALIDACAYPAKGGSAVDDCHQVIIPQQPMPGLPPGTPFIPQVIRYYKAGMSDTAWAVAYPNDTVVIPNVPYRLTCAKSYIPQRCLTCEDIIYEAVAFKDRFDATPDTAYALPQLYANIINSNYGFNLTYYEFTRFLNSCDTIYKILYTLDYKTVTSSSQLPQFVESIFQPIPMDFPGGVDAESEVGTCACNKLYNIYLTWLDLKNKNALTAEYQSFHNFAKVNGFEVDAEYSVEDLLDRCKEWVDITELVTMNVACRDSFQYLCNGVPSTPPCENPEDLDSLFMGSYDCDTTYLFDYCEINIRLKGADKACAKALPCDVLSDTLNAHPELSVTAAQNLLSTRYGGDYTVIKTTYPLDPDTCSNNCTREVFATCGGLTSIATQYFEILNEMALMDTLDAEDFNLDSLYTFRKSEFNRKRDIPGCSSNSNADGEATFTGIIYGDGGIPVISAPGGPDYTFTIGYDEDDDCHVYLDSLHVTTLDSIERFIDIRPTTVYTNGTQYFTFKVVMESGDTINGKGHTTCFSVSECCPPNIRLCNRPLVTQVPYISPCKGSLKNTAIANGKAAYQTYIDSVRTAFRTAYIAKCIQAGRNESLEMEYEEKQYHYTLYYYDRAGNLLQTVPPAGVQMFTTQQQIDSAIWYRKNNPTYHYAPGHTLPSAYNYNSLNQLIWQRTPDADTSEFFYDRLGRLAFSQNKKQKNASTTEEKKYSYTVYDVLGRINEVGEVRAPHLVTHERSRRTSFINDSALTGSRSEITRTKYDYTLYTVSNGTFTQQHLRGRVAHVTYQDADNTDYRHAVHYTYDIHGNVNSMVRENLTLTAIGQQYKQVDYDYDLISGKVNMVSYQQGEPDQYFHRYDYDADNRLTQVYTSTDSVHWDKDARYYYYLHGPLARTEVGQHQVQGIDYAYTLHGWLKGVNSNTLTPERDMGKDGWVSGANTNRNVARDVYGFTLSYYSTSTQTDYNAINKQLTTTQKFEADLSGSTFGNASFSLYNGNIKSMVVAISKFMESSAPPLGYAYQYDQLNRLVNVNTYNNISQSTNTWNSSGTALTDYNNTFTYDANGNILTQLRKGSTASGTDLDNLSYTYKAHTNQLTHVDDAVTGSAYTDDIDDQSADNYQYDEIGNLIKDVQEEIETIEWTVYGKIKRITRTSTSLKPDLEFEYTPDGHRVCKIVKPKVGSHIWTYTYYVRDAQGNIMATYDRTLEAIFNPENTDYADVNAELVALNGAVAFKDFIQVLHPESTSTGFINNLKAAIIGYNELDFLNHLDFRTYLTSEPAVYTQFRSNYPNTGLATAMYYQYGPAYLTSLCSYDMNNFVTYFVAGFTNQYLQGLFTYDQIEFDNFYNSYGTLPPYMNAADAINQLNMGVPTLSGDLSNYIITGAGCSLHNNVLTTAFSTNDLINHLSSWSSIVTATDFTYGSSDILDAVYTYDFANVWDVIYNTTTPVSPATNHVDWFFANELTATYEKALLYNYTQVAGVQDGTFYYSKTNYFQYIKDEYGQYTHDVLVGKFIHLSNQFKDMFALTEWHMYGSSRLGVHKPKALMLSGAEEGAGRQLVHIEFEGTWNQYTESFTDTSNTTTTTYQMSYDYFTLTRGEKNYELTNHLGNVLAIISDKKLKTCEGDTVNYYMADLLQATDYSAFHATLKDRVWYADAAKKYRFGGSNGQERDDDVAGEGRSYSAEFWQYSPDLGRRFNVDPKPIPALSVYACFRNNPICFIDAKGDTPTVKEGALMSQLAYGKTLTEQQQKEFDQSGWKQSSVSLPPNQNYSDPDGSGLKSVLFERTIDGKTEYALAFAGTEDIIKDGKADLQQIFGKSKQYDQAVANAISLQKILANKELTFVGHSLGGGLANVSALATGNASLAYNPAWISTATMRKHNLFGKSQLGISNYVIVGEIVTEAQMATKLSPRLRGVLHNVGKAHYLFSIEAWIPVYGDITAHFMESVIEEIEDVKEYNTIKNGQ